MKKNYLNYFLVLACGLLGITANSQVTYDYTGVEETYIVPPGITFIHIEVKGAKGMNGSSGGIGGNGAFMSGDFVVTPGEELKVYAGGNPAGIQTGGDGSYVGHEDDTPMIVGGGGGSGGYGWDGAGAVITEDGTSPLVHVGGDGGTDGDGGIAGTGEWGTGGGGGWYTAGTDGEFPGGTPGGETHCLASGGTTFAGGAGGGYSGGGGCRMFSGDGTGGGGAGGSYNSGSDQVNTAASNTGLGQVIITELCTGLIVTVSDLDICVGESITVHGESLTGGIVMWDGGIEDEVPYLLADAGTYEFTATSTSGTDCIYTFEVTVHELPAIVANADPETVCFGQELTLSGSGGAYYEWSPGDIENGEPFVPGLGTMTYTVEGEDWYGCFNTAEVTVTVIESPDVTITASDESICLGESITLTGSGAVTYEWDMGVENGVSFTPETTGSFIYTVAGYVDGDGCFGEASIEIAVNELPTIESYVTTEELLGADGSININVTGGTPAYDFDWDNDGVGEFGDSEDLTGIAGGTYIVVVKDANGCEDTETISVNTQLGIGLENSTALNLYPNPTNDMVTIQVDGTFNYSITTIGGQKIMNGFGNASKVISMNDYPVGVYFVTVTNSQGTNVLKLIKN